MLALALVLAAIDLSTIKTISAETPEPVQIEFAEAAAPPEVTSKASIYVLGPEGYRLARKGTNAFTCFVDRTRPDTLEPICMDAEGFATTFQVRLFVEQQRAAHVPEEKIAAAVQAGYAAGHFRAPRRAGIVYMMSDYNIIFDGSTGKLTHIPGHLMFYAPGLTEKDVGTGHGAPFLTHPGAPDNLMIVVPRAH